VHLEKEHLFIVHMLRLHDILYKSLAKMEDDCQIAAASGSVGHIARRARPHGHTFEYSVPVTPGPGWAPCRGHHNINSTMRHITKYIHVQAGTSCLSGLVTEFVIQSSYQHLIGRHLKLLANQLLRTCLPSHLIS